MNNVFSLVSLGPRVELIKQLQEVLPACAEAARIEVGPHALRQFFNGYKDNKDLNRMAA